ncbi:MAG TPA: hypothetical protein VJN18_18100 [Polyangiaceae bacterium]|nr:hypothetical protein [Polyangiaceae bacterium]
MNQSIGLFVACLLGLGACNFENYEDCKEDELDFEDGHSRAGKGPHPSGKGASASGGGSPVEPVEPVDPVDPVDPVVPEPPATPCEAEQDCDPGFNCDYEAGVCAPADAETCGELMTEESCTNRTDCKPIYAGVNCSCGTDCECVGGQPGCVCESFEFFVCQAAE